MHIATLCENVYYLWISYPQYMLLTYWNGFLEHIVDEKEKNPTLYSIVKQLTPIELTDSKIKLGCDKSIMREHD